MGNLSICANLYGFVSNFVCVVSVEKCEYVCVRVCLSRCMSCIGVLAYRVFLCVCVCVCM